GRVALIGHLAVVRLATACRLLDGAVDVVLGHVGPTGVLDGHLQPGVGLGVGPTGLHAHGDLLADAGEELAQLGIAGEDLVLAFLENAAHGGAFRLETAKIAGSDGRGWGKLATPPPPARGTPRPGW